MTKAESAQGLNKRGVAYFRQGQFVEAVALFQQAIDLSPNYADAYYNLGLALKNAAQRSQAVNVFSALILLQPQHLGAHFQLASIYMQREHYQQALAHFTLLLAAYPDHVESVMNVATCYLRQGRWQEARSWYERALTLTTDDAFPLYNLGVISAAEGRNKEAIQYYLRALRIDSDMFATHNNLAVVYLGMGDVDAALLHFRAALTLDPENAAVRHSIRILTEADQLHASPAEYIRSLFDAYADHYDAHLSQTLDYQVPCILAQLVSAHDERTQLAILDVGCGTGLCGEVFKSRAKTLVGVDLSTKMLAVAADKHLYDELVLEDVNSFLADRREQYDLIVAGDVLVYFGDLAAVLCLMRAALRPGGRLVFNVELGQQADYALMASGRFAHKPDYLRSVALASQLTVIAEWTQVMRRQNGKEVVGSAWLMQA